MRNIVLFYVFFLLVNMLNAQTFNIVSDDVKKQRKDEAQRVAYLAKVNEAWGIAEQGKSIESYDKFLSYRFNSSYNNNAIDKIYNLTIKINTIDEYDNFLFKKYNSRRLNNQVKENIFGLTTQRNTIETYEQFLLKSYNIKDLNNQAKESIFIIVSQTNTISRYEKFLAKNYRLTKLDNQAIANIYKLTAQIDAVEGYRSFLQKYPNAADAEKATKRLYEIMYAIAEEENDIASYYGFLVQFPKAQVLLREKAYINMQMLEVEKSTFEYNLAKQGDVDYELKERAARQLYIEAIRAKESGDQYTFMRKYNTVLYSDLFKDTQAAFDLFRDKELAKLIRELRDEIRQNTYAVNSMRSALTSKLNEIQNNISSLQSTVASSQNDYSPWLEDMVNISRNQANDWAEWATNGTKPSGWFGSPNSY